jgi:hypothetical protein
MSIVTNIPTVDDYRNATRGEKSTMRTMATNAMMDAVGALDMDAASAWRDALAAWKESNERSTVSTDWNALASVRVANLRRAADMIEMGATRPNGMPDEIELTFDSTVVADDAIATRIASEPINRSEKSDLRGSIAEFVVSHMTVGTFYTCTEIAHMVGSHAPAYADRRVSGGAVRNALESNKIPNVVFVPSTSDNVNGCRRTA